LAQPRNTVAINPIAKAHRRLGLASSSPGKYAGQDNGWILSLIYPPLIEFDKSIIKYPNIPASLAEPRTTCGPICRTRRTRKKKAVCAAL
jgi:hypothetical protein